MNSWDSEIIQLLFDCKKAMQEGTPSQQMEVQKTLEGFFSTASNLDIQLLSCTFDGRYKVPDAERVIPHKPKVIRGTRSTTNKDGFYIADYYLVEDVRHNFVRELEEFEVPPAGAYIADGAVYLPQSQYSEK